MTGVHLRLYFLQAPRFKNPNPLPKEKRLEQLGDERFLETTSAELLSHYQDAMTEAVDTDAPVVRIVPRIMEADGKPSALVLIAHKIGETHSFFAG